MQYKGVIRNNVVALEEDTVLPEGTQVIIIPKGDEIRRKELRTKWDKFDEGAEKVFQYLLSEIGKTSDSVEILRQLREERANR